MIEVLVWLLISIPVLTRDTHPPTVVERFKSKEQCEHVQKLIRNPTRRESCIQAYVVTKS